MEKHGYIYARTREIHFDNFTVVAGSHTCDFDEMEKCLRIMEPFFREERRIFELIRKALPILKWFPEEGGAFNLTACLDLSLGVVHFFNAVADGPFWKDYPVAAFSVADLQGLSQEKIEEKLPVRIHLSRQERGIIE